MITTINVPLASALYKLSQSYIPESVKDRIRLILDSNFNLLDGIFIQRSVKQLLFEGYPDLIMSLSAIYDKNALKKRGRFSWMASSNDTNLDHFTVHTGRPELKAINTIFRFNGDQSLPYWSSKECNSLDDVLASSEFVRPVLKDRIKRLRFLDTTACRVMNWTMIRDDFKDTVEKWDIEVKSFGLDDSNFKNSYDEPLNECYDTRMPNPLGYLTEDGHGIPSGALDISMCHGNSPILLSKPHFLNGDDYYFKTIDGLNPSNNSHNSYCNIEPKTGIMVRKVVNTQLNVLLVNNYNDKKYGSAPGPNNMRLKIDRVPNIIYPVYWISVGSKIPHKPAKSLWMLTEATWIIGYSFGGFFGIIGIFVLPSLAAWFFYKVTFIQMSQFLNCLMIKSFASSKNRKREYFSYEIQRIKCDLDSDDDPDGIERRKKIWMIDTSLIDSSWTIRTDL